MVSVLRQALIYIIQLETAWMVAGYVFAKIFQALKDAFVEVKRVKRSLFKRKLTFSFPLSSFLISELWVFCFCIVTAVQLLC